MFHASIPRWARIAGVIALATGCSGRAVIDKSAVDKGPGTPSTGGATSAGSASVASSGSDSASGAAFAMGSGGTTAVSAGGDVATTGLGGATTTGSAGASAPSYCGIGVAPPEKDQGRFASPGEVWNRINVFVVGQSRPAQLLPGVTTRQWAGDTATALLDSFAPDRALGIAGFVSQWLPGTPNAELWGSFFSNPSATLSDLLTTTRALDPGSGVLTDPALLTFDISGRGTFISNQLLCRPVPPPPANVPPPIPLQPGMTRRQQLEASINSPACASCHSLIDPLGNSLEHFSAAGDFSNVDNGQPIDSSGQYTLPEGNLIRFANVNELAQQLAASCTVAVCFTQQLLANAQSSAQVTPPPSGSSGEPELGQIALAFSTSGLNLRALVRAIVQSDAFLRP